MNKRYEFRVISDGHYPVIWDNLKNEKVNFLRQDIVDYLNTIHEQEKMISDLKNCLKIEQNTAMELARKVLKLSK